MLKQIHARVTRDPWWHIWGLTSGLLFALMLIPARLHPEMLDRVDGVVEAKLATLQTFTYIEPFLVITVLGSVLGVTLLGLVSAYLLRRNRFVVLQLFLVLLFSSVSMGIAKTFVARTRPEALLWLDPANTYSFPSGHATLSTTLYGFLAVCMYRRIQNKSLKLLSVSVSIFTILLVCLSRIVLNYHYITDVTAGVLLGIFWLSVVHMLPAPNRR